MLKNQYRTSFYEYEMFCEIWYHLLNFKNVKNTDGGEMVPNRATHQNRTSFYEYVNLHFLE